VTWDERHTDTCVSYPALAAVYEAPDGRVALLLRHTIVPLPEERDGWLEETARAADEAAAALRDAGLVRDYVVVQWQSFEEAAAILTRWRCRYLGDPERCDELAAVVGRFVADRRPRANGRRGRRRPRNPRPPVATHTPGPMTGWYEEMAECWLAAGPPLRRSLILRTHRFIAERLLLPLSQGETVDAEDVEPGGALARLLGRAVPARDAERWRPWIEHVVADLRRSLAWPQGVRDDAWARWLFLIPFSIPAPRALSRQTT
jgi:hypothetical protein